MAGKQQHSYPPDRELAERVRLQGFVRVAEEIGISPSTLRSHLVRRGLPTAKDETEGVGTQTFTLDNLPDGSNWTPEALLELVGLPTDGSWEIKQVRARGGHWGRPEDPSSQVRLEVVAAPARPMIKAPDLTDWTPLPKPKVKKPGKKPLKVLVTSDHHAPRHEKRMHELICLWIKEHQPDWIIVNGDLLDFPSVSTHRTEDEYNHSVNECLKAGLRILRDYREAAPNARMTYQRGNHEARLDFRQQDKMPEIRNVAPGGGETADGEADERPWHDLSRLLWLDELHIEYNPAPWEQARIPVSSKLSVRHGVSTSANAGRQVLEKLSHSNLQGHDHRLWMALHTEHTHEPDDPLRVRMAMSVGCCCEIPGGLGYVNGGEPNWQNGAAEVTLFDNGDFHISPIIFAGGRLLFAGGRYQ